MLESELKSRNDKLDKCTEAVINGLHQHVPQIAVRDHNRTETLPKRSGEVGGYLLKQATAPQNPLNECYGTFAPTI